MLDQFLFGLLEPFGLALAGLGQGTLRFVDFLGR
jgi:hypothetical protein